MQRHIQQSTNSKKRYVFILILAAIIFISFFTVKILNKFNTSSEIHATNLAINASYKTVPFGKHVIYYDGMSLHCITVKRALRWSVPIGLDGDFDTDGENIVAWSNTQIYVIDSRGNQTHNDNLGYPIQFARIGSNFVGIATGEENAPHLYIIDLNGNNIDQEINAYDGYSLLNMGFFGENSRYMWTLSFDIEGSVPDTILTTFQVGQKNTGSQSLGDALVSSVIYDGANLKVINTRQMRTFDFRGTENINDLSLVYGWTLIDHALPSKNNLSLLFAPTSQASVNYNINELRLITPTFDMRYPLPSSCVGAVVTDKALYAFSDEYIYKTTLKYPPSQRFIPFNMPANILPDVPTDYLGTTTELVSLLMFDDTIYAVHLP